MSERELFGAYGLAYGTPRPVPTLRALTAVELRQQLAALDERATDAEREEVGIR